MKSHLGNENDEMVAQQWPKKELEIYSPNIQMTAYHIFAPSYLLHDSTDSFGNYVHT